MKYCRYRLNGICTNGLSWSFKEKCEKPCKYLKGKRTNYECIQRMDIEEMGEFLSDIYFKGFTDGELQKVEPHKYTVEWLMEEAKNER